MNGSSALDIAYTVVLIPPAVPIELLQYQYSNSASSSSACASKTMTVPEVLERIVASIQRSGAGEGIFLGCDERITVELAFLR